VIKLNLCAGGVLIKDTVSIDINPKTKPDVLLDVRKEKLPYEDGSIEEIHLMHGPEHIERHFWDFMFMEIKRVLIPNGRFIMGYPEFRICADKYLRALETNDGQKDYFLQTIYGRRQWEGDEHVTACNSFELQAILESCGFYRVKYAPEDKDTSYNSLMVAFKDPAHNYREQVVCNELGLGEAKSIQDLTIV
jgi:predicted SAM-dependent methyltransferase